MPTVFEASSTAVAIYTVSTGNETDSAPFTDPAANISRVKLHSDFRYPEVIHEAVFSITLPQRDRGTAGGITHTLGAHGRGFVPLILASATVNGSVIALAGTIPIQVHDLGGMMRTVAVGCDASSVFLHERYVVFESPQRNQSVAEQYSERDWSTNPVTNGPNFIMEPNFPAVNLQIRVLFMDVDVENPSEPMPETSVLDMDSSGVRIPNSGFSTDKRYLRSVSPGTFAVPTGPTWSVDTSAAPWTTTFSGGQTRPTSSYPMLRWSFKLQDVEARPSYRADFFATNVTAVIYDAPALQSYGTYEINA